MEKDNGDMTTGLMCLGCGRITQASTMFWTPTFLKKKDGKLPLMKLMCPECQFISPVNINFLVLES